MQNTYELLYIVPGQFTDEEVAPIMERMGAMVTEVGGSVKRHNNLGRIKMAYEIKGVRNGSYVLMYFSALPSLIQEVDRRLRLTDEVLRHTICLPSKGSEERTFELTAYVAPLSDEGRPTGGRSAKRAGSPKKSTEGEDTAKADEAATEMDAADIDKKVDELLTTDIAS